MIRRALTAKGEVLSLTAIDCDDPLPFAFSDLASGSETFPAANVVRGPALSSTRSVTPQRFAVFRS